MQFPAPWPSDMKRFDYTAVEVNKIVMERKLNEVPEPLQLAKFAELMRKEDLPKVNDMISIVHYPKEKNFVRCENPEVIKVLDGKLAKHRLLSVNYTDTTVLSRSAPRPFSLSQALTLGTLPPHVMGPLGAQC